jgi:hypothetical protein
VIVTFRFIFHIPLFQTPGCGIVEYGIDTVSHLLWAEQTDLGEAVRSEEIIYDNFTGWEIDYTC